MRQRLSAFFLQEKRAIHNVMIVGLRSSRKLLFLISSSASNVTNWIIHANVSVIIIKRELCTYVDN